MKINYIDHNDSFSSIIAAYFMMAGADVNVYRSTCNLNTATSGNPDLMLLGPGPNSPTEAGNYMDLLDMHHKDMPFFGICLGFQAIMQYFGQSIVQLEDIMHGGSVPVTHIATGIFEGIPQGAHFARYNSLGVYNVPENFEITAKNNGVIMAARHKTLPTQGVQFHPESSLSTPDNNGIRLIENVIKMYGQIKK
jgi:anthranilate synthase/aminodeoxychorismate synthase-like glutamine amidotransferase